MVCRFIAVRGASRNWFLAAAIAVATCCLSAEARGPRNNAEKDSSNSVVAPPEVDSTLREAIGDEMVGDSKSRDSKLDDLIATHPELSLPRWQKGLIETPEGWSEVSGEAREPSEAEAKYLELRKRTANDAIGHKQLAAFARKNKLAAIAAGHWRRVLDFSPDDPEARKALGHIRFDGAWTTKGEAERVVKVRKAYNTSLNAWSKKISGWVSEFHGADAKRKAKARENLLAIRDAAALPVLNGALAYRSDEDTLLLLEILCQIPDFEATRILAEQAIINQSPQVLRICSEELKNRDEQSFVPQLLIGMSSPITSSMQLDVVPQTGQVFYRHVFIRETQYDRQLQAMAGAYVQDNWNVNRKPLYEYASMDDPTEEGRVRTKAAKDQADIEKESRKVRAQAEGAFLEETAIQTLRMMAREQQRVLQNMTIEETNKRIALLLSEVFDQNYGLPEQWWKWWNNRHEVQQPTLKPLSAQFQYQVRLESFVTQSIEPEIRDRFSWLHSCFVAGTPVVTPNGTRPIESLGTGDLVLSQSIETGELTWKPVVRPTTRPKTKVLKVIVGDDSFVCTLKHPFWKVGRGWVWAKDLVVGDLVRTSNGSLPITEIEKQPDAPVFNLVVADFSTYFVGKNQTLTHDITFRAPTLAIAPGVFPADEDVATK
jgi:hypothetical protein